MADDSKQPRCPVLDAWADMEVLLQRVATSGLLTCVVGNITRQTCVDNGDILVPVINVLGQLPALSSSEIPVYDMQHISVAILSLILVSVGDGFGHLSGCRPSIDTLYDLVSRFLHWARPRGKAMPKSDWVRWKSSSMLRHQGPYVYMFVCVCVTSIFPVCIVHPASSIDNGIPVSHDSLAKVR